MNFLYYCNTIYLIIIIILYILDIQALSHVGLCRPCIQYEVQGLILGAPLLSQVTNLTWPHLLQQLSIAEVVSEPFQTRVTNIILAKVFNKKTMAFSVKSLFEVILINTI